MDLDVIMAIVICGLGFTAWGYSRLTDAEDPKSNRIPLLVLGILLGLALILDAALVATGVIHISAWREGRRYVRGVFGLIIVVVAVWVLVRDLLARRRPS
jgi:hypothetical protein